MTKMADFYRTQKVGAGKRNPILERLRITVGGEESREEPQVLTI